MGLVSQSGLLALVGLLVVGRKCAKLGLRGGEWLGRSTRIVGISRIASGWGKCAWLGLRGGRWGDGLGRSKWIVGISRIASGWGEMCMAWIERGRWAWSVKVDCWH